MTHLRSAHLPGLRSVRTGTAAIALFCGASLPAQEPSASAAIAATASAAPQDPRELGMRAQRRFEDIRRMNAPRYRGNTPPSGCRDAEPVGNMCYWYDEKAPPIPEEPARIVAARDELLGLLDSLGEAHPGDNWISAQRVRYLNEVGRNARALEVAKACRTVGWWCDALEGFALHALRRYVESEAVYERALTKMTPHEQCRWRDLTPYLDDDTRRQYARTGCNTPERDAFEARTWWYARTRYGMAGNDSRTEHFARVTYMRFLDDAPSAFRMDFDDAEKEMLQRFGWPVAWARGRDRGALPGVAERDRYEIVSSEPTPAYRFIPPYYVIANPANSDSTYWQVQRPPVVARYHPPYAKRLVMLEHQQALFRRGDTALVVLAYDVSGVPSMKDAPLEAALVLTPGTMPDARQAVVKAAPARGTVTVRAPWGPLLMSAEVAAETEGTLARARYGIRPPFAVGARVVLSDLLFYTPYGSFPNSVEEVLPHAIPTQRVRSGAPLGVYWEAYNTNPAGEPMTISLTVVPETEEAKGFLGRTARALRLAKESEPVSITVEDMSARGLRTSPRAVQLDISTLKAGDYLVQLEISVAGQYTIRADRRIVVTGP